MSGDELDLHGDMFKPDAGVPGVAADDFSGALDLSDLIEQVERGESEEQRPPSLTDSPSLLWTVTSGLHSSLLSTAAPSNTAEAWQLLAEELAEESRHSADETLKAALMCEAGRILVDRLGRQEEGQLLMRNSKSAIASTVLQLRRDPLGSVASQLEGLEQRAADASLDDATRAASWVEFGQVCETGMGNRERALEAYAKALELEPDHAVALAVASEAAALLGKKDEALAYFDQRLAATSSGRLRAAILLERAELLEDRLEQRAEVRKAHESDPSDETALRRLIRLVAADDSSDPKELGALHRELARIAEDPVSKSTAMHLAFLTLADAGEEVDELVHDLVGLSGADDSAELLAPLSEVALYLERRVSGGTAAGLPANADVLDRVATSLDAPREQALVREQMARIRLNELRRLRDMETAPAKDSSTGLPKLPADKAQLCADVEADLRFCLVHLPEHRWVREALAELLEMVADVRGLVVHLQEWARTQTAGPGRAAILLRLGDVHENLRRDLPRAAEVYELAVAEDPDDPNCLRALGRVYEKMRRWPQAVATFQRQARETMDGPERLAALRRVAAMAQRELDDPELAIATLEEVARLDPDDLLSLFQLAAHCRTQGRTPVLVNTLQLLVERLDDDTSRTAVLVELGEVLELQLRRRQPARESYERALRMTPGYTPALRALARLYRDDGDFDALLALHEPNVDSVTDPAVLALKAARICVDEIGDIDRAIGYLLRAYETNPDLVPARELLLQLLTVNGRIQEAFDLLRAQEVPDPAPVRADHHYRLGLLSEALARQAEDAEARRAHLDDALQSYRAAAMAQPNHGLATERSRRLLVGHHDLDNLVRLLRERAELEAGPERSNALTQVGRVLAQSPEAREDARRAYDEAYQSNPTDPVLAREYEGLLRRMDDRDSLPALYLQAARGSGDTHFAATLFVEASELLLESSKEEDRNLAATAILDALRADPGNPYAVRHLDRLLTEPDPPLAATDAVSARAVRAQSDAERAIFYLESAELLEAAGAVDQSRRAYMAALAAMPELLPAKLGLDRLASTRAAVVAKRREVSAMASLHNLMAEAREAAVRAGSTGEASDAARAIEILSGILRRNPEHRDALALGRALVSQLPDPAPALRLLDEVFPAVRAQETRYDLAVLLADHAPRLEDSAAYLQAAVEAKPDGRQALRSLVAAYRQLGRDKDAADVTERLLELFDPSEPSAIDLRMGLAAFLGSDPETLSRALEHAKLVMAARADDARAILLYSELLERNRQKVEAAHVLDRIIERERDRSKLHEIYVRQAKLLATSADHQSAALEAIEQAVHLNPGHRESVGLLAALLERAGQLQRLASFVPQVRAAMLANVQRGALSLRDIRLLAQITSEAAPELSSLANAVCYALEPTSAPPPADHLRVAPRAGIRAVLQDPDLRLALYAPGETPALHEFLAAIDPAVLRIRGDFRGLSDDDAAPLPPVADTSSFQTLLQQWAATVGLPGAAPEASTGHNTCLLIPGSPPTIRLGSNLWMQGDPTAWRGLCAVALARHAWGTPVARSLSQMDMDLVLAASFETVGVFNAITADPDPRRLQEVTGLLGKHVNRRQRKLLERAAQALSGVDLLPGATAHSTLASDLRLAAVVTGDAAGCLSAACLLDGVAGGRLKARINRSRSAQALLGFLLSESFASLRTAALSA